VTDPAGLLLVALLCAEVAAVGLAWHRWRTAGSEQGSSDARPKALVTGRVECETGSPLGVRTSAGFRLLCLLLFALVDELAVEALHVLVFAGAPRPLAGWARLGWHLETAFVLGWPAGLAAACWRASEHKNQRELFRSFASSRDRSQSSDRRRTPIDALLGCYLGLLASLVLVYPLPRARLRWLFLAWEVACVALAWFGLYRARLRPWGPVERCLVVLAACETMVATVGPFASDPFLRWWIGGVFYLGAWGGVVAVLARGKRSA